jgi:heat shock protein HslJ
VKRSILLLAAIAGLAGCMPRGSDGAGSARPPDGHNSRNALDWAGTYSGVMPCADCPGIEMRLTLQYDGSYTLSTRYQDRQPTPQTVTGRFSWNAEGNTIKLDAAGRGQQFRVGEGRLLQLNQDGSSPGWDASHRALTLQPAAAQGAAAAPALARALQDHRWTLQSAADAGGKPNTTLLVPNHPFVLRFQDGRLNVQGGCNTMNGSWQLGPQGQLIVGRMAATMKACEPALMQADKALADLLATGLQAELGSGSAPTLRLTATDRQSLAFSGERTPQSLYGQPTRIFLEVGPQTVDCVSGVMRTQCLQVRERRFDAQGLRIDPPGEWRIFHGGIDGYTHTPGVRNVLRIDRYQRQNVPADASRYVYVLDMVVENETVSK